MLNKYCTGFALKTEDLRGLVRKILVRCRFQPMSNVQRQSTTSYVQSNPLHAYSFEVFFPIFLVFVNTGHGGDKQNQPFTFSSYTVVYSPPFPHNTITHQQSQNSRLRNDETNHRTTTTLGSRRFLLLYDNRHYSRLIFWRRGVGPVQRDGCQQQQLRG